MTVLPTPGTLALLCQGEAPQSSHSGIVFSVEGWKELGRKEGGLGEAGVPKE